MNIEERNKLIQTIYDLGLVQNYAKKISYKADLQDYDDIQQELFLILLEVKDETWEKLLREGKENDPLFSVRAYVSGLIYRQIRSKNSKIYSKFKKYKEHEHTQNNWGNLENIADDPFDYEKFDII